MKFWLCGLMLLQMTLAAAEAPAEKKQWPVIREIAFSGNDTTQPKTMLREMSVHVGDPADPAQIEHSRQAVQDLGLFKSVDVRQEPTTDGVKLVYTVREKFYFLPYPRLSANVDKQYSYGAELEWNNVAGLNHNLRIVAAQSDANRAGYGKQTSYSASYIAPFIADTKNNLSVSAGYSSTPLTNPMSGAAYTEIGYAAEVLLRHIYSTTAASQGWTAGTGLLYQHENRFGPGAAPPYGTAYAVVGVIEYRDLHDKIYSEEGQRFSFRHETALRGVASDYGYTFLRAGYDRFVPIGERAHQTLQYSGSIGGYFNGPQDVTHFSLGGSRNLRGFPGYSFEGNAYYYGALIYQRPIVWDWLRVLGGVEVGNVTDHPNSDLFRRAHVSLALGLRLRVSWFVDLQFEAGWAVPLERSAGSGRFFGGRL